jgi:hypothetical protein
MALTAGDFVVQLENGFTAGLSGPFDAPRSRPPAGVSRYAAASV